MMIPLTTTRRKSSVAGKIASSGIGGAGSKTARLLAKLKGAIRSVVSDANARNLMAFLALNFSFAFVELIYGVWTNSLGLISDSFHMFFDCTGLVAGLVAQVVSRWPADDSFAYGYRRAEVLAGFVNALFLLFVAFFILTEAVERAIEPPTVHHHDRLMVVSVLGLLVNLVGVYVFQHGGQGHGHSHGGGSHGHSHGGGGGGGGHGHSHGGAGGGHGHSHDEQVSISMGGGGSSGGSGGNGSGSVSNNHLMKGVLLHVLADTLGSVGVIVSALLMRTFGWMRADPVCSIFIAVLVAASVWGLLRDSARILMMRTPTELDHELEPCYARLLRFHPAVLGVQEPRFWTLCADAYAGSLKIEVRSGWLTAASGALTQVGNASSSSSYSAAEDYAAAVAAASARSSPAYPQLTQSVVPPVSDQLAGNTAHHELANRLVRHAQQVFAAISVRHLYVQIDYTDGADHHHHHHLDHDFRQHQPQQLHNSYDQQQYNHSNHQQQQQQQQPQQYGQQLYGGHPQQQYANPLLMM